MPADRHAERRQPRRLSGAGLVAAILLAAVAMAATVWTLERLPLRPGAYPRIERVPAFERPGRDSFFTFTVGDELSQGALYHDLGGTIEHARRADVLFLGNSRMPLGLREEVIVPAAEALGLRVFSLACGHSEKTRFALDLIRRHDLRPKVVVASGGPHVFTDGISAPAAEAIASTRWDAWKRFEERRGAWAVQSRLHAVLPKLDFLGDRLTSEWILYRSRRTGWWQPVLEPRGSYPVSVAEDPPSYDYLLPLATELRDELGGRGALLVLTMVPYREALTGHLPFLGERLGVPWVLPPFDGIGLADGSHLERRSAVRYSAELWERFMALPEVRLRLGLER